MPKSVSITSMGANVCLPDDG